MKRLLAIILALIFLFSACSSPTANSGAVEASSAQEPEATMQSTTAQALPDGTASAGTVAEEDTSVSEVGFTTENRPDIPITGLDDESLLTYVEGNVYASLVQLLNSEDYFVENVEAVYYPKEYIEALAFNSQPNLYFGYTSAELDAQFQGTRYVFTLGADGQTTVVPMETVDDDAYVKALENVIIGTGVILICVTVSLVAAPAAPAVGMIFAASASTGTTFALESGAIGFAAAAIAKGFETENFEQAIKAGVEAGGEGFKWGAIIGAAFGGIKEGTVLYGAARQTRFTINQYARIQQESGYPLDMIKEFHTMEEYQAFRDANLKPAMVGNKTALIKTDIDLTRVDAKGRTNLERMRQGLAPQDSNGVSYELHHIGQKKDGTLAILTQSEHDNPAIHGFLERTEAHGPGTNWDAERQAFWKCFSILAG